MAKQGKPNILILRVASNDIPRDARKIALATAKGNLFQ
jgi:hypothetical protein